MSATMTPNAPTMVQTTYPVNVVFDVPATSGRFWAIPLIGFVAKTVVLIPHLVVLYALSIAIAVVQLVSWIPVLSSGQYPEWAWNLTTGTLRWHTRVYAYLYGLTDQYPPFSFVEDGFYPVRTTFERQPSYNRMYAIPVAGYVIRVVLLIPTIVVLYALTILISVLQLVLWAPVLFTGTFPAWGADLVGGWIRWGLRVGAYAFGLTDQYPPFALDNPGVGIR
jgi:hypothetical protein